MSGGNPFDGIFGGESGFLGTCDLCGESTFLQPRIVESKAGKVHACCNLDITKWRRWFEKQAAKA